LLFTIGGLSLLCVPRRPDVRRINNPRGNIMFFHLFDFFGFGKEYLILSGMPYCSFITILIGGAIISAILKNSNSQNNSHPHWYSPFVVAFVIGCGVMIYGYFNAQKTIHENDEWNKDQQVKML
jgi:hypothetical protein